MWLTHREEPMHKFSMPEEIIARVVARVGCTHPFDKQEASKTAFVVIDMQSYYLKSGYLGDVPLARYIVPRHCEVRFAVAQNTTPVRQSDGVPL